MNIVIAIVILLVYTIALCIKGGGIPSSLSASVFWLPYNKRWLWTVTIYAVGILVLYPFGLPHSVSILDKVSEDTQFLAFIAIAALMFVGAAPLVKDKQDIAYKVHCTSAAVCAVASQALVARNNTWLLLCWAVFFWLFLWNTAEAGKTWDTWRTKTFWAEQICFFSTFALVWY